MANEILGEVKINEDITEEEVKQEEIRIENALKGGVQVNVNGQGEEIKTTGGQPAELYDAEDIEDTKNNIVPIDIEEGSVPKFEKISQLKTWIAENLNLIGDVTVKENGRKIQFSKTNISRSMKGVNRSEVKRDSYSKLKELVENAIYDTPKENDSRHPNVKGQEIYYNKFNYKGKIYGIEISVDIPKSKNTPYTYAGHKIKIAPAATRVGSDELTSNRPDANNIIPQSEKNITPSELYDISEETPKKQPKTLKEVEEIADKEAEQEEEKTGIKGLYSDFKQVFSEFIEPFYTEVVDRFAPIQNTVKRANKKGAVLGVEITDKNWTENPYNLARMYSGLANRIWQHFKENTTQRAEDGTQKITGEGFLPIIDDYVEQVKDMEANYDKAIEDLSKFLYLILYYCGLSKI